MKTKYQANAVATHSNYLFVEISGGGLREPTIVASVYVMGGTRGAGVMEAIGAKVRSLALAPGERPMVVMGDLNREVAEAKAGAASWHGQCRVVPLRGRVQGTRLTHQGVLRTIDHVIWKTSSNTRVRRATVDATWDTSDHWPLITTLEWRGTAAAQEPEGVEDVPDNNVTERRRFDVRRVLNVRTAETDELLERLQEDVRWAGIAALLDEAELATDEEVSAATTRAATALQKLCETLGDELGLRTAVRPRGEQRLPRGLRKLVDRKRKLYAKLQQAGGGAVGQALLQAKYVRFAGQAKRAMRRWQRRKWGRATATAGRDMRFDPRKFWQWASARGEWQPKDDVFGFQPLRDPDDGGLRATAVGVGEVMSKHFGRLAADPDGHGKDVEWWARRLEGVDAEEDGLPELDEHDVIPELNEPISAAEVSERIKRLKRNKAPGLDGLPAELFKALTWGSGIESPAGAVLVRLINLIFQRQAIPCGAGGAELDPSDWTLSIVVAIHKKGDKTDLNNYRGISLMAVGLKILTGIVADRLLNVCEARNFLHVAQAGFRRREEASLQATALIDVVQRRRNRGKASYITFIDLKKAYDVVPHAALFAKLERYGIGGTMFAFIKKLYEASRFTARYGDPPFHFSPVQTLERGLRQGCGASPILFNIFGNDLPAGLDKTRVGAHVPSGGVHGAQEQQKRCSSFLFADDIAMVTGSVRRTVRGLRTIDEWICRNKMEAGTAKCGVLVVEGRKVDEMGEARRTTKKRRLERLLERGETVLSLGGDPLPLVSKYTYLGLEITEDMSRSDIVDARVEKGKAQLGRLTPFLVNQRHFPHMRLAVLRSILIPILLYGAEFYGMRASLTSKMQGILMEALFRVLGGTRAGISHAAVMREFNVPHIAAVAAARRIRAYQKAGEVRTEIAYLRAHPDRGRQWTWTTGTMRWMNRWFVSGAYLYLGTEVVAEWLGVAHNTVEAWPPPTQLAKLRAAWPQWEAKTAGERVRRLVMARENARMTGKRAQEHERAAYLSLTRQTTPAIPNACRGYTLILRMRLYAFWTTARMARRNLIPVSWANRCPSCDSAVAEDEWHILAECAKWEEERTIISEDIAKAQEQSTSRRYRLRLLLGGQRKGVYLEGWSSVQAAHAMGVTDDDDDVALEVDSNASVEGDQQGFGEDDENSIAEEHEDDRACTATRLACFLGRIWNRRWQNVLRETKYKPVTRQGQDIHAVGEGGGEPTGNGDDPEEVEGEEEQEESSDSADNTTDEDSD